MAFRSLATVAAVTKSLRIGLIPADGIGREVIPVSSFIRFALFFTMTFQRRQPAEYWRLWDLTFPNSSFMTYWPVLTFSLEQESLYLVRLYSEYKFESNCWHTRVVLNLPTYSVLKEGCDAALFGAVR